MKIYPSRHEIIQTQSVNLDCDIPLAFINTSFTDYTTNIIPEQKFIAESKEGVIPYSNYNNLNVCLFDENEDKVDNTSILQRDGDKYVYIPQNVISFNPQRFNYSVTGKKKLLYSNNKQYNIKASCVDSSLDQRLAKQLMKVFGDAPRRGICPSNISVNDMDLSIMSLIDSSIKENDFIFIDSVDGINYGGSANPIILEDYLKEHTNVWLTVDKYENALAPLSILDKEMDCTIKNQTVVKSTTLKSKNVFYISETLLPTDMGYNFINLFNETKFPVLLMEHSKKGFVIVSHKSFLDNIEANINMFYEIMMHVYLNTYLETEPINEWIADAVPDYVVSNGVLSKKEKFTSSMELGKMFGVDSKEIMFADIKIDAENVSFVGITSNYVVFNKEHTGPNQKYADPPKPESSIAVFTSRQNIIYYDKFIYQINNAVGSKLTVIKTEDNILINVKPFKHSLEGINILEEQTLSVSLTNQDNTKLQQGDFYICCKDNVLNVINKMDYKVDDGIVLATLEIRQSKEYSNIFDMRQKGGGLPEDKEPNYDLLDIGHIYGRPIRKAGTLIFKLPERLKPYEDIILKAIKTHMVAEDLPILIFNDNE